MARERFRYESGPDPCPDLLVDRGEDGKGVGRWVPEQKHQLLAEYLYSTRNAWKKWEHRIFLDPFCGAGRVQVKDESFTRDGGAVVAWRTMASHAAPFTKVLVGDLDKGKLQACAARLQKLGSPVLSFSGPAVDTVPRMVDQVPDRDALTFAYLDPYNLELLSFEIIKAIARLRKVDFAVHFSTMDLSRNVEFEADPQRARFDEAAPGWRQNIDARTSSKAGLPVAFFQYWCDLVRGLGFGFSKEMPLVFNDRGNPIYRLIFFSRHELPKRIWADVARGPNRSLPLGD